MDKAVLPAALPLITAGPDLMSVTATVTDQAGNSCNPNQTATESWTEVSAAVAASATREAAATRRVYIETVGCQMNVLDSELVIAALRQDGYELTNSTFDADTILFNTCSVRQHAEDKIYSALGRLKRAKQRRPDLVIGVLGCMAQKDQDLIFTRAPHVDLIVSPGQLAQVPELIRQARQKREPLKALGQSRKSGSKLEVLASFESYDPLREPAMRPNPFQAYVRLMMGCDKFCTYCIVPTVRGPEQGRHPDQIVAEVRQLVDQGVLEITFLGQTVNSYKFQHGDGRVERLADLLYRIHDFAGLRRIKFITNYPKDMTDDLLTAVRTLPKVSRYFHVPAQHGCDSMLKRMKRGYTIGEYHEMMVRIREQIPEATISSDFIVGFCGETEEEFQTCLDLVNVANFKNSFVFKYSPRPGTKAFDLMADDVAEEIKKRRNNELLSAQAEVSLTQSKQWIGKTVEILVEGPSKSAQKTDDSPLCQMTGRTREDRIVVYDGNLRQAGQFLQVHIRDCTPYTLIGDVVTQELVALSGK